MSKYFLRTGLSVLIVLALLVSAFIYLLNTESGTRYLWRIIQVIVDEEMDIGTVSGRLGSSFELSDIDIASETAHVRVSHLSTNWDLAQLINGKLIIQKLVLRGVHYTKLGSGGDTDLISQLQRLNLPFSLQVQHIKAQSVDIFSSPGAKLFRVDQANAALSIAEDKIDLAQVSILGPTLHVNGNSQLSLSNDYPVTGKIDWKVQPEKLTAATGKLTVSGTLNRLTVDVDAKSPYPINGQLLVSNLMTQAQSEFDIVAHNLSLADINTAWPAIQLTVKSHGQKTASGDYTTLHTELTASGVPHVGSLTAITDARFNSDEIVLTDLLVNTLDHPMRMNGQGRVALTEDIPHLDLKTTWRDLTWPLDGNVLLSSKISHISIQGPLTRPSFVLDGEIDGVVQPVLVDASVELDRSSDRLGIQLDAQARQLRWPLRGEAVVDNANAELQLTGTLPELVSQVEIRLGESNNAPTLNANGRLDYSNTTRPRFEFDGDWHELQWPLNTVNALVRSDTGTVHVVGTTNDMSVRFGADVDEQGHISGTLVHIDGTTKLMTEWRQLAWLHGGQPLNSERGTARLTGKPSDYHLQLNADLATGDRHVELTTKGHGDLSSLTLDDIDLQILQGVITGSGKLAWKPNPYMTLNITGKDLNPASWWQDWSGRLDGQLHGEASLVNKQLTVSTFGLDIAGQLRDYPVQLNTTGNWQTGSANIESLQLRSGQSQLQAQGRVGDTLALQWQVDSDELRTLHPQANGSINGTGLLSGSLKQPRLTATLAGRDLQYLDYSLKTLNLDTLIDITDQQVSHVSAKIEHGLFAGVEIQNASINANGVTTGHKIDLDALTSLGAVDIMLNGKLNTAQPQWLFTISSAAIDTDQFDNWNLLSSSSGQIDNAQARLSRTCVGSGVSELCLDGTRTGQGIKASFDLKQLPLKLMSAWLPENFTVEGAIDGDASLDWQDVNQVSAELHLHNSGGQILVNQKDTSSGTPERILVFEPGNANIELNNGEIKLDLDLPLAGDDEIRGHARITASSKDWTQSPLQAELTTAVNDISFLTSLIPEVDRLAGSLHGKMRISGSVHSPIYDGQINVQEGLVELLGPNIVLRDVNAQLSGSPLAGMDMQASVRSGGGQANIEGRVNLARSTPSVDLAIRGEDFQIMNTPQAIIHTSPDLQLTVDKDRIRLRGDIRVPAAQISLREIPQSAIKVSADQTLVNQTSTPTPTPAIRKLDAQVRTTLGDNVTFNGFGLNGRLRGDIVSSERPGEATTAKGEIRIEDGHYRAYGQNLTIETGRLLFSGAAITQPVIDLRATRQPTPDVLVGIVARGTLQQPDFSLFSEPSMTERNQLSYLLLGRPADIASNAERSALGEAALAFGLNRAGGITDKISQQFGLDTLGVEAQPGSTSEQAAFVIGKYLAPKLYVSYGIGLFEPVNTLRMQYSIDQHWKLVTESSGKASGGDIIYSVERGR